MYKLPFIHLFLLFFSWSFLEVTTSSQYNDSIQAYAAGVVEAAVTSQVSFILVLRMFYSWELHVMPSKNSTRVHFSSSINTG